MSLFRVAGRGRRWEVTNLGLSEVMQGSGRAGGAEAAGSVAWLLGSSAALSPHGSAKPPWGWQGRQPLLFPSARAEGSQMLKKLQVSPFLSLLGALGYEGQYIIQKKVLLSKGGKRNSLKPMVCPLALLSFSY